ncbi:glycerophosphodiester phosphodiesterase family protein [Photobacterium toruni]|uniref:Glycerophosphodiester phosphodiesterase family protein n=1 Tax=Photobacterium toruni TaxID=1935446 RepID=A0A1T4U942_9GAMM|nr:glycerophosphodiester phosphodiesterase family protein [Photobacterium toruni]MEC6813727.1 glycerophosphodiester phosphodiesterase family protein [Photobacterium toruni]MEC6830437.1 glycerophosphodiester phosphodiesterase family protein [Photobacterium toruni]SKA49213.1 Glycerophosphoryl diester phosphodiesterase [Photobacterium toruni]
MIAGHRGARAVAPENTLISMKAAADAGATWIETDTQLCDDLIPVIIHDKSVRRCTNGSGSVRHKSLSELKQLDAGSWFATEFADATIPTLVELLQACDEYGLSLNLEIKVHYEEEVELQVLKTIETIKDYGFDTNKLILSSFSYNAVKHCLKLWPEVRRGLIIEDWVPDIERLDAKLNLYSIHLDHHLLNEKLAKEITDAGKVLQIWTMNDPQQVAKFTRWGVSTIISDNPGLLISAAKK